MIDFLDMCRIRDVTRLPNAEFTEADWDELMEIPAFQQFLKYQLVRLRNVHDRIIAGDLKDDKNTDYYRGRYTELEHMLTFRGKLTAKRGTNKDEEDAKKRDSTEEMNVRAGIAQKIKELFKKA